MTKHQRHNFQHFVSISKETNAEHGKNMDILFIKIIVSWNCLKDFFPFPCNTYGNVDQFKSKIQKGTWYENSGVSHEKNNKEKTVRIFMYYLKYSYFPFSVFNAFMHYAASNTISHAYFCIHFETHTHTNSIFGILSLYLEMKCIVYVYSYIFPVLKHFDHVSF